MEGMSIPFKNDIHYKNGISCADCHGGDPNSDDQNISMSAARGFKVRVTRDAVSEYCARCHADAALIHKHNPGQRVDQLSLYQTSVHAAKPAGSDTVAANCIDCHSVHNIRAVDDPQSPVSAQRLTKTCGKCHSETLEQFQKSAHAKLFVSKEMPGCDVCHASHATQRASGEMLAGGRAVCMKCHEPDSKGGMTAASLERAFERGRMAIFSSMPAPTAPPAGAAAARGTGGARGGVGFFAATNEKLRAARIAVHSMDVPTVRAAIQAAVPQQ